MCVQVSSTLVVVVFLVKLCCLLKDTLVQYFTVYLLCIILPYNPLLVALCLCFASWLSVFKCKIEKPRQRSCWGLVNTKTALKIVLTLRGSTNAGMEWNGMDYWNGQKNQIPWVNWPDWTCTWI